MTNIQLKIEGGTRSDVAHLCRTCRHGIIVKGGAHSQETAFCQQMGKFMPIKVAECNRYLDATAMTVYEMEQIAWLLITKKAGRQIGFQSPEERFRETAGMPAPPPAHSPR
jgi:hypothetical protein